MTTTPALARTALQRLLSRTPQTPADHANAAEVLACIDGMEAEPKRLRGLLSQAGVCPTGERGYCGVEGYCDECQAAGRA